MAVFEWVLQAHESCPEYVRREIGLDGCNSVGGV